MKRPGKLIVLLIILIPWSACSKNHPEDVDNDCPFLADTLDFSFQINYENPETYLIPGEQSDLNDTYLEEIQNSLEVSDHSIEDMLQVCQWVNQHFMFENAGGGMIGKPTVNELFEAGVFYGCHSQALIISSVLRKLGFPVVVIETADVQWAYDFNTGNAAYYKGHVMSEVFVDLDWILLDNNGSYVRDYDPGNPFIPQSNYPPDAYFVFAKGTDYWDYSQGVDSFTYENLDFFAENVYCYESLFHTVDYVWSH
jgi:hypothetical protein